MSHIGRTLKPLLAGLMVLGTLQAVPEETKRGGASHEISSNGI